MGNLETVKTSLTELVYEWRESVTPQGNRPHLGFSQVGDECGRKLWYIFRHVSEKNFDGRMLRLFDTGNIAEGRFVEELRGIGCEVWDVDPTTGNQIRVVDFGGHVSGSCDAVVRALLDSEAFKIMGAKPHLCEMKTHNEKSFEALAGKKPAGSKVRVFDHAVNGVANSKPVHYVQANIYAYKLGLDKCLYIAANKNTDEVYIERWNTNKSLAKQMIQRAVGIANSQSVPAGISQDPSFYKCKMCDFHAVCHMDDILPLVNCRTCLHSTPTECGDWHCAWHNDSMRSDDTDMPICAGQDHRYIPELLKPWFTVEASQEDNSVTYELPDGRKIINGGDGFSSEDIRNGAAEITDVPERKELGLKVNKDMPWSKDDLPF
jgi:hypothetical protein